MDKIDFENCKISKNEVKPINVNGYTISYSESKNRDRKHILFLHGLGTSLLGWRDIPDALSEQFHTISVDLIGFGGSDKPKEADYTIKGFSKFILDFIQAIDIVNEKICIVGHSLGGYIALQFAIENKSLVEKIARRKKDKKMQELQKWKDNEKVKTLKVKTSRLYILL